MHGHQTYAMKIRLFTVPNIITLMNLLAGCAAIVSALRFNDIRFSFYMIIAAAVLDFFDGFAARLLKQYSPLGKELDSLADVVSFGVAPSAVLLCMFEAAGGTGWAGYLVFILAMFSALRLAKFNIDDRQTSEFIGLPVPACAIFVSSAGYLMAEGVYTTGPWYVVGTAAVLSYFLVCNTPMFSLKFSHWAIRGNELRYGFLLCSVIALAIWQITAVPFIILAYIAVSVTMQAACPKHRGRGGRKLAHS